MNKIVIGSDEGTYTVTNGARTITLAGLSFTPSNEQLAYIYNKTQDKLYYAPGEGLAKATLAGLVITIDASFPVLATGDVLHIQMWRPAKTMVTSNWFNGTWGTYSNATGDFIATITNATKNITITGLPFTLDVINLVGGNIFKISNGIVSVQPMTNISVSGGVITLGDALNFVTGDTVVVILRGPDKSYDKSLDVLKIINQNPDYGHYTSVETLVAESAVKGSQASADAGGDTDTIVDADGAFSIASTAVGYKAYQTTDCQNANVTSVDSATTIQTGTLSGDATWASKAYSLPLVKRYEIPMEGYNNLTMHYYLSNGASLNTYMKIYGTLNPAATADADTSWVDMSLAILGNADGINVGANTTVENLIVIPAGKTMLKYMIKLVVEYSVAGTPTNTYNVYIKKSS